MFLTTLEKDPELDPAKYFPATELAWQAALKKTKVKLELLTDIDMLLMVAKGTRSGLCHSINNYAKANNKIGKIIIKIKNHHILNIAMLTIYMLTILTNNVAKIAYKWI